MASPSYAIRGTRGSPSVHSKAGLKLLQEEAREAEAVQRRMRAEFYERVFAGRGAVERSDALASFALDAAFDLPALG
jgi:hypothetical protein